MRNSVALVLSGGITHKGKLPFFVKLRLDHVCKLYHSGFIRKIIVSGKWSYLILSEPARNEAVAMAEYLESLGVKHEHILLEEKSQDLLSSAYYVKKLMQAKKIHALDVIGSDFQEERVRYVFGRIFEDTFHIAYRFVSSNLPPSLLWGYYRYEKKTLLHTKAIIKELPIGQYESLADLFFKGSFYEKRRPGFIRTLVSEGKIGKPSKYGAHYSLKGIYKKKNELYEKYKLVDRRPRTLVADFWSGRFLNFSAQNPRGELYSLKFLLRPQDRKTFEAEIKLTKAIRERGITYISGVLDSSIRSTPMWYIYKIVPGKMVGEFSITYSFNRSYQEDYFAKQFVDNIRTLQKLKGFRKAVPINESSFYRKNMKKAHKKILQFKDFSLNESVHAAAKLLEKNRKILSHSPKYLSHSDLHPGNVIVDKSNKKVYFIDLEHVAYSSIAFDFCFGYIFCWDNPLFQQRLLELFKKSLSPVEVQEFDALFPHLHAYFLFWFGGFVGHWRDRAGEERYKAARSMIVQELRAYVRSCNNSGI